MEANATAQYPRSVSFDGQTFQTRHVAARAEGDLDGVLYALVTMAARRRYGRKAWLRNLRADSWAMNGSSTTYEATVCLAPWNRNGTPFANLWFQVRDSEIEHATAAVAAMYAMSR